MDGVCTRHSLCERAVIAAQTSRQYLTAGLVYNTHTDNVSHKIIATQQQPISSLSKYCAKETARLVIPCSVESSSLRNTVNLHEAKQNTYRSAIHRRPAVAYRVTDEAWPNPHKASSDSLFARPACNNVFTNEDCFSSVARIQIEETRDMLCSRFSMSEVHL